MTADLVRATCDETIALHRRLKDADPRLALAAIGLTTDTSVLTSIANDDSPIGDQHQRRVGQRHRGEISC